MEVSVAGRRGSAVAISSQPITCATMASSTSQKCAGKCAANENPGSNGAHSSAPIALPIVASNSGPAVGASVRFAARNIRRYAE